MTNDIVTAVIVVVCDLYVGYTNMTTSNATQLNIFFKYLSIKNVWVFLIVKLLSIKVCSPI